MPSPGADAGAPGSSSRDAHSGASTGAPEGPLSWMSGSPSSVTEGGPLCSTPVEDRGAGDSLSVGPPGGPPGKGLPVAEGFMGPPGGPHGDYLGASHEYREGFRFASSVPRVLRAPKSHLSLRGPGRGTPTAGAPLQASAAAAGRGVYVHLTDAESYSSGGSDEEDSPAVRGPRGLFRGGPPSGRGALSRGPLGGFASRVSSLLAVLNACWRLAIRRLTLGFRFLLFWAKDNERQLKVLLYTATLLISSTGNTIAFKRMVDKMPNYSGFLNQLTNFVFIPIFALFCFYQYSVGKLSQEVLSFPKRNFALMGCLDGVCGIMAVVGGVHTSGTAQVVLSQLGIPAMLILCRLLLGTKYNVIQHLGAAVIIVGVLVVESSGLLHPSKEDSSNIPIFNLVYLLSVLPSSLSYVVKEIAFRGVQMNTSFLQFWVALFQFFIGFVLLPLTSLPVLGNEVVPLSQLMPRFLNGGNCLFGVDSISPPDCGPELGVACDSCQGAWVEVVVYVVFNLIYNVCALMVLKHCGATLLFLVMTVRLPLTSMAFYSRLIVGDSAVPAKATDFFGLAILLVGLLAFRLGGQKAGRGAEGEGEVEEGDGEGSLERDITAAAEAAHVHIKVLANDPSVRNDGYFHYFSDEETPTPRPRRRRSTHGSYVPPSLQAGGALSVGGPPGGP